MSRSYRRALALPGLALVAGLLMTPAAHASPVFDDPSTYLNPFGGTTGSGGVCTATGSGGAEPNVPIVENGGTASASTGEVATFGNTGAPTDTGSATAGMTATGAVTSSGGSVHTMDFNANGTAQLVDDLGLTSSCYRGVYSGIDLDFGFTVTQPGFLTITSKNAGTPTAHDIYGEVYIYQSDSTDPDEPYFDVYGYSTSFNNTERIYLPAGKYNGYFEGETYMYDNHSTGAINVSTTVHGVFSPVGAQTAAATGKAAKYTTLGARSCATHSVGASITGKKKVAGQIKQVKYYVNNHKVKTVKKPNKGSTVALAVADNTAVDVRADVTLFPAHKGKKGKSLEVTASYEACTP